MFLVNLIYSAIFLAFQEPRSTITQFNQSNWTCSNRYFLSAQKYPLILDSWSYSHVLSKPNNSLPSSSFIFISKRYQSQLKKHKVALDLFNDILGLKLYLSDYLRPLKSLKYVSFRSLTESRRLCFTLEAWKLQRGVNSGPGNLAHNWINIR